MTDKDTMYINKMELRSRLGDVFHQIKIGGKVILSDDRLKENRQIAVILPLPNEAVTIVVDSRGNISYE